MGDEKLMAVQIIIVILFFVGLPIFGYNIFEVHVESKEITEHIVDKQIVYDSGFMEHQNKYYIYTENYCFNVQLSEYNQLKNGSSVNITVYGEIFNSGHLNVGDKVYVSE